MKKRPIKSMIFPIGRRLIALLTILLFSSGNAAVAKTIDQIDQVGNTRNLVRAAKMTLIASSYTLCDKSVEKTKQEAVNETAAYRNLTIIFVICSLYRIWRLTYGYRGD